MKHYLEILVLIYREILEKFKFLTVENSDKSVVSIYKMQLKLNNKAYLYYEIQLLVAFLLFTIPLSAQNKISPFQCGHEYVLSINEQNYSNYREMVNETFSIAYKNKDINAHHRNDIYKIPVVVHIVWKNSEENLDDSLIFSQIKVLNKAFRLQNEDKSNVRDIFKDLQSDAEIEFELKEVKRVKTSANFALSLTGLPDNVKRASNGGSGATDPDRHLNIWVCKIQPIPFIGGQILGYAYPPTGLGNWPDGSSAPSKDLEGVVIDYRVFGLNNPNKLTVNGSTHQSFARTTVHEVGHYLGLRHIWGDGGGLFGGNSCDADDGISDTPNQGTQSPGGCDTSANTCIEEGGNDLPDMIENYMDYSGENCQNTFTKEQVALMRSVLANQRQLLTNTEQSFANQQVNIWPNPFQNFINITLNENIETKVKLTSLDGSEIMSYKISEKYMLDVETLRSGTYLLEVVNDKMYKVLKLIKAHE